MRLRKFSPTFLLALICGFNTSAYAVVGDVDNDGKADVLDNCIKIANPPQLDVDYDGYGNGCDGDLNNDGVVNAADRAIFDTQYGKTGANIADFNGDKVVNSTDLSIFKNRLLNKPLGPSGAVVTWVKDEPVVWQKMTSASDVGGVLSRTVPVNAAIPSGGSSTRAITGTPGLVKFTLSNVTAFPVMTFGLNHDDLNATQGDIDFAFALLGTNLLLRENGNVVQAPAPGTGNLVITIDPSSDVLSISTLGNKVQYLVNDEVIYTSTNTATYPLVVDTALAQPSLGVSATLTGNLAFTNNAAFRGTTSSATDVDVFKVLLFDTQPNLWLRFEGTQSADLYTPNGAGGFIVSPLPANTAVTAAAPINTTGADRYLLVKVHATATATVQSSTTRTRVPAATEEPFVLYATAPPIDIAVVPTSDEVLTHLVYPLFPGHKTEAARRVDVEAILFDGFHRHVAWPTTVQLSAVYGNAMSASRSAMVPVQDDGTAKTRLTLPGCSFSTGTRTITGSVAAPPLTGRWQVTFNAFLESYDTPLLWPRVEVHADPSLHLPLGATEFIHICNETYLGQ